MASLSRRPETDQLLSHVQGVEIGIASAAERLSLSIRPGRKVGLVFRRAGAAVS
jgi:hypothetical protein